MHALTNTHKELLGAGIRTVSHDSSGMVSENLTAGPCPAETDMSQLHAGSVPYMAVLGILSSIALAAGIAQYMGLIELRPSVVASVHGSSRNHTVPILGSNGQIIGFGSRGSLGSGEPMLLCMLTCHRSCPAAAAPAPSFRGAIPCNVLMRDVRHVEAVDGLQYSGAEYRRPSAISTRPSCALCCAEATSNARCWGACLTSQQDPRVQDDTAKQNSWGVEPAPDLADGVWLPCCAGGAHPSHPSAVEHLSGVLRERQKALLGGLELGELLGRGSFGKVYKGEAWAPPAPRLQRRMKQGQPLGEEGCRHVLHMLWEERGVGRRRDSRGSWRIQARALPCSVKVHAMGRQELEWPYEGLPHDRCDESACHACVLGPAVVDACAGRWRGAMVAVKIVTHDRTLATLAETLRESALSTSIQHPNVVCIPALPAQYCLIRAFERQLG